MHMDDMVMDEKKKGLKELIRRMYQMISDKHGDGAASDSPLMEGSMAEEAAESPMAEAKEKSMGMDDAASDAVGGKDDDLSSAKDNLKDEIGSFMKSGRSMPMRGKGTAVMISMKAKPKFGMKKRA